MFKKKFIKKKKKSKKKFRIRRKYKGGNLEFGVRNLFRSLSDDTRMFLGNKRKNEMECLF